MKTRKKTRAVTCYVDPQYEDKLTYLRYTCGVTAFIEQCLDDLHVDLKTLEMIKMLQAQQKKSK